MIRGEIREQLEKTIEYTHGRIGNLYGGVTGLVVNPVLRSLYGWFAADRIRSVGLETTDLVLDLGGRHDGSNMERLVSAGFPRYVELATSFDRLDTGHRRYPEVEALLESALRWKIEPAARLLRARGSTYPELVRDGFPRLGDARRMLTREFEHAEALLRLVREENVVRIPALIRNEVRMVTASVLEFSRRAIENRLQEIYANGHAAGVPPAGGAGRT